jgi:hypothetical protein
VEAIAKRTASPPERVLIKRFASVGSSRRLEKFATRAAFERSKLPARDISSETLEANPVHARSGKGPM